MDEKTMEQTILGAIGIVIVVALAAASGVLPWAILAGGVTSLSIGMVLREWIAAVIAGASMTAAVSAFGIASMLSPGWYEGLR